MAKLHLLAVCFVIIICKTNVSTSKSLSHVELNVRPLNEKQTSTISYNEIENNSFNVTDKPTSVLTAMLNLFQNIENKFLAVPSNSHIYYTILRILILPKNGNKVNLNTTGQVTETVISTEKVPTSTIEYDDDDDDSTRPITLFDIKSDKFSKGKLNHKSIKLPEVEHGSVQSIAELF